MFHSTIKVEYYMGREFTAICNLAESLKIYVEQINVSE